MSGLQAARRLDAVHHGHPHVHQDDVGRGVSHQLQGLVAVARLAHDRQLVGVQERDQGVAEPGVVVHQQDPDQREVRRQARQVGGGYHVAHAGSIGTSGRRGYQADNGFARGTPDPPYGPFGLVRLAISRGEPAPAGPTTAMLVPDVPVGCRPSGPRPTWIRLDVEMARDRRRGPHHGNAASAGRERRTRTDRVRDIARGLHGSPCCRLAGPLTEPDGSDTGVSSTPLQRSSLSSGRPSRAQRRE